MLCITRRRGDLNTNDNRRLVFCCRRVCGYCIASECCETKSKHPSIEHRQSLAGVGALNSRDNKQLSVSSKSQYKAVESVRCLEFHEIVVFCLS